MMSPAVTGPMPSISSSCSAVAVPRLIGPSSPRRRGGGAPAGPALRHDHLLPVGEPRREVDRFQLRPGRGAAGAVDGVVDPAARRQPVDAGAPHRAGHVDDHVAALTADREARAARIRPPRQRPRTRPRSPPSPRIARAPTSSSATATAP